MNEWRNGLNFSLRALVLGGLFSLGFSAYCVKSEDQTGWIGFLIAGITMLILASGGFMNMKDEEKNKSSSKDAHKWN